MPVIPVANEESYQAYMTELTGMTLEERRAAIDEVCDRHAALHKPKRKRKK